MPEKASLKIRLCEPRTRSASLKKVMAYHNLTDEKFGCKTFPRNFKISSDTNAQSFPDSCIHKYVGSGLLVLEMNPKRPLV